MASDPAVEIASFDALPEPVLRVIMLALPVDARGRAACVCRSWRAFLAEPSLWQVLDLTAAGGVVEERVTENLVRGAVAAGQRACPPVMAIAARLRVHRRAHLARHAGVALTRILCSARSRRELHHA